MSLEHLKALILLNTKKVIIFNPETSVVLNFAPRLAYAIASRNASDSWTISVLEPILYSVQREFAHRLQLLTPIVDEVRTLFIFFKKKTNNLFMNVFRFYLMFFESELERTRH